MYRVNVDGTEQLLRLAAAAGVRRVVHTSTQNTVGQLPSGVANEDCAFAWWNEASHYTRSKLLAEQAALAWAGGGGGLEVVVVNPSGPFGPGDLGPGPTGKTIVDFIRRRYPVVIDGMFNAIDVADLAHAEVEACLRGQSGRRYLLGGHDFTIGEFFALLEELTSVPAPRWRLPRSLALGLAQAMELASDHLTRRPPKLTVDRIRQRGRVRRLDCSRARAELGLRTTPIRDTLARAIAWFREVGYV
jgi:dihydroflavonol-4-reductase